MCVPTCVHLNYAFKGFNLLVSKQPIYPTGGYSEMAVQQREQEGIFLLVSKGSWLVQPHVFMVSLDSISYQKKVIILFEMLIKMF